MCEYSLSAVLGNLAQWSAGAVLSTSRLFNCLEQHYKTAVMVDGDVLVTTLPLAYVSYCMPNLFFGSCGFFV